MKIILYSNGCPNCKDLKERLDSANIKYDIFSDVDKMIEMGFKSVPKLRVDDTVMDYVESIKWIKEIWYG